MDNNISNEYISDAIDELIDLIGIKEDTNYYKFKILLDAWETKKCIKAIACQLALPMEINVKFVQEITNQDIYFQNRGVEKTGYWDQGMTGIAAQVSIPNDLPFYWNPLLKNFPINVKVNENCNAQSETFVAVMAHELSHLILHSLKHPQRDNELFTDLIAMILGFSTIIEKGRKVQRALQYGNIIETKTTTYGYLSDDQFQFAKNKIRDILQTHKNTRKELLVKIDKFKSECSRSKKTLLQFNEFREYLDKHHNQTIRKADSSKIISFHQASYTYRLETAIKESERFITDVMNFSNNIGNYSYYVLEKIKHYGEKIKEFHEDLKGKCDILIDDVNILRRYVSLWQRIRTAIELGRFDQASTNR